MMNKNAFVKAMTERIYDDCVAYIINEDGKTVSFVGLGADHSYLKFPRSITYKSHEYIVKNILCSIPPQFTIHVEFAIDSEVETIEMKAFANCNVLSLSIPSSLIELKEGWCIGMDTLTQISVDKNNPKYSTYDSKFIIGKSSIDQENYDLLVFARRDIKNITIPSFIETILPYSFGQCGSLREIKIPNDSSLKTIEKHAFHDSAIEIIIIDSNEIELKEMCFSGANKLKKVIFNQKNPRYSIYDDKYIIEKSSNEQEIYDILLFAFNDFEAAIIPDFIRRIASYSFYKHEKLKKIEFSDNSNIESIGEYAFDSTSIENLSIPAQIEQIGASAFDNCISLKKVEVPINSKLKFIEKMAFWNSSIESFTIPSCVTRICKYSFNICKKLKKITIPFDSKLERIEKYAFNGASIESFIVPPHVKQIDEKVFAKCNKLQIIELDEKSELEYFDIKMFNENEEEKLILIPDRLKNLLIL
ncbi:hypothetical protein M9Y10_001405 [Tritrichomonas musculus]|uniref:Leucine-rich repeat domain-containing protein n=1 Tax=Tritrichomonas musculus TaxID=1915356 RepID=A0ABR2L715_9EUKA